MDKNKSKIIKKNNKSLWLENKDWELELKKFKPLVHNALVKNNKADCQTNKQHDSLEKSTSEWQAYTKNIKPLDNDYKNIKLSAPQPLALSSVNLKQKYHHVTYDKIGLINKKTLKKIKAYRFSANQILDLHSCTVQQAEEKFNNFILYAFHNHWIVVQVITGKGNNSHNESRGILKKSLLLWLENNYLSAYILSYAPKYDFSGDYGSFYLFLRKNK